MKIYFITLFLFLSGMGMQAQNITSAWQRDTHNVGSGLKETYCLSDDGSFEFILSQYLNLNTIISFKGIYKIQDGKICFTITSRKEMVGGRIVKGSLDFEDNWVIEGGEVKEIEQKPEKHCFDFEYKPGNHPAMVIGNTIYYQIDKSLAF